MTALSGCAASPRQRPISAGPVDTGVGSLAMGLLAGLFALKFDPGQSWRLFLTTGILGGFTTFSTFSLEAVVLYERGELVSMAAYVIASVMLSIGGLFAGLFIVRQFG